MLYQISIQLARGRGFVIFWRRCNCAILIGFVDDVMFFYRGPYGVMTLPPQHCCIFVYSLTPLLHGIDWSYYYYCYYKCQDYGDTITKKVAVASYTN